LGTFGTPELALYKPIETCYYVDESHIKGDPLNDKATLLYHQNGIICPSGSKSCLNIATMIMEAM
jgi:hypothetical protein